MTLTQACHEDFCAAQFGLGPETEAEKAVMAKTRLLSGRLEGLDVTFELAVAKTEGPFAMSIPWTVHVACPRCFGQGRTFAQAELGAEGEPTACPRCGGQGYLDSAQPLCVEVTERMAKAGSFVLEGAGAYDPKTMCRGDLRVNFAFVDDFGLAMAS